MNPQSGAGLPRNRGMATPNDSIYVSRSFYAYAADAPSTLGTGASTTYSFNIAKDSDFFWTKLCCHAVVGDAGTVVDAEQLAEVTIMIVNTTNSRQYMNSPIPLANISGSGRLPFILPIVTLWEALTTITITLANTSDDVTYSDLYVSFLGIRAFLA
jgi:hypothetical protein